MYGQPTLTVGQSLDRELCGKLMGLPVRVVDGQTPVSAPSSLAPLREAQVAGRLQSVDARNGRFFDEEVAKLERWADDLKLGLERELKDLDQEIKEARREGQAATALTEAISRAALFCQRSLQYHSGIQVCKSRYWCWISIIIGGDINCL